jgi:nitrite reductase (NADH) large subunit
MNASGGIVVVGGGISAQSVVEELRQRDADVPITMISAEGHMPYDRVRLSELFDDGRDVRDLQLRPDEWYADNNVDVLLDSPVRAVERVRRVVVLESGREVPFDRLCLATGSEALLPPIQGIGKQGVFAYRYPADCAAIATAAGSASRAAVIGGGLLGLEAARGVVETGTPVTVVHLMDRLMERQLDPDSGGLLRDEIEGLGIEVLLEHSTAEVLGNGKATGLRFEDGSTLDCDLVVISAGIRARTELARAAGLECERGIVVDDHMRTSDPQIYAVGECAQHQGIVYGVVAPIYEQAATGAAAMLGDEAEFTGTVIGTKLKVMGVDLVSIGDVTEGHTVAMRDQSERIYRKLAVKDGRLVGAVLMGDTRGFELLLDKARSGEHVADPVELLAQAGAASAAELPDSAQVCNCNGVCKGDIVEAIRERGLSSVQEVVAVTRAGTGCGSCKPLVAELVTNETGGDADTAHYLCPCRQMTRDDLVETIREGGLQSVSEVANACEAGRECGACKPGIAYLVSEINDNRHREERHARFINDRVHANIQRDGTFSVVPRIYGGVTTPDELARIADVARRHEVPMVKLTGGQRIDLLGVSKEKLPEIWEELGMPSGHAYTKAVRTVKTCVGTEFCRFGIGDAIGLGIEAERAWEGLHTPHKVKCAVSGCPRNCAEASTKDIGAIAVEGGWQVRIGGAAGARVREGDVLATVDTRAEAMRVMTTFLQYYRENGEYLERTYDFVERVGLETVRSSVLDEDSGEPARLRERLWLAKAAVSDPWLERRKPVHPRQFTELDPVGAGESREPVAGAVS